MKNLYKKMILQAVENCHDLELLDLVWKILTEAEESPSPNNKPQEVKYEDDKRIVRIVPHLADRTGETVRHTAPDGAKLAWRAKKPAGLRCQYDDGAVAA